MQRKKTGRVDTRHCRNISKTVLMAECIGASSAFVSIVDRDGNRQANRYIFLLDVLQGHGKSWTSILGKNSDTTKLAISSRNLEVPFRLELALGKTLSAYLVRYTDVDRVRPKKVDHFSIHSLVRSHRFDIHCYIRLKSQAKSPLVVRADDKNEAEVGCRARHLKTLTANCRPTREL